MSLRNLFIPLLSLILFSLSLTVSAYEYDPSQFTNNSDVDAIIEDAQRQAIDARSRAEEFTSQANQNQTSVNSSQNSTQSSTQTQTSTGGRSVQSSTQTRTTTDENGESVTRTTSRTTINENGEERVIESRCEIRKDALTGKTNRYENQVDKINQKLNRFETHISNTIEENIIEGVDVNNLQNAFDAYLNAKNDFYAAGLKTQSSLRVIISSSCGDEEFRTQIANVKDNFAQQQQLKDNVITSLRTAFELTK